MKIHPVGVELFHADRRTDMTKVMVAFRSVANAPKIQFVPLKEQCASTSETSRVTLYRKAAGVYHCYVAIRIFSFYYTGIRLDFISGLIGRKESEINVTYYLHRGTFICTDIGGLRQTQPLCVFVRLSSNSYMSTNTLRCRSLYSCMVCLKWHHVPKHVVRLSIQSYENTQKGSISRKTLILWPALLKNVTS